MPPARCYRVTYWLWPIAFLAVLLAGSAMATPRAERGVLDLRGRNAASQSTLEIQGEWGFDWGRFTDPALTGARPAAFATTGGPWNDETADGKPGGPDGYATYSLTILCDAGQKLALLVPAQRTAQHLYVNGQLESTQGQPGASANQARAAVQRRAMVTGEYACPMHVVMHLSNYSHRAGGFVRVLSVGPRAQLVAQREQRLVLDTGLMGSFLVLGLIPIIFFAARRKDPTPLLFGLFCLALATYSDMTGERALLLLFSAETGWETYLRIEYLSWFLTMALFSLLVQRLFPAEFHRWALRAIVAGAGLGCAVVLLTPARLFSHLAPPGQALSLFMVAYVTWIVSLAARHGRTGARAFLAGMAFLLTVILLDAWLYNNGHSTVAFTPFGLLVFVLAPAIILARRLARALNAEELRALEQRGKADLLVRSTKAGIYDWDATRGVVTCSERLKEMLGHAPDADTSHWPRFYEFVHPDDRAAVQERFMSQLRNRSVASGELRHAPWECRLRRTDGSHIWVLAEAISLKGSDRRTLRYICSFIDISERRAMEEGLRLSRDQVAAQAMQLERQNEALMENVRLREEVERMSRHDIKTPLNSIIAVPRLLREEGRLSADHMELLGIVERAGYRVLEMVNLSVGLFKMERGSYDFRPQAVNLRDIVRKVLVDLRSQAESKNVNLRFVEASDAPVYARAEDLLCYSITANLLKNAVEASPDRATVTISIEAGDPLLLKIHNPSAVPESIRATFFDKYVTAGKSGGTGLGTYSARLMARIQEGDVNMVSSEAQGTLLTVSLKPLTGDAALAAERAGTPAEAALVTAEQFEAQHVLVTDDDEYNRLIMRRYLPSPPFTVETAVNGRAAIEAVAQRWPDIILIDLEMPVMNGLRAVAWVREQERLQGRKPCTVVMLSSNDDALSMQRSADAGCDRYMIKPVTREALLSVLHELRHGGGSPGQPVRGGPLPDAPTAGAHDAVRVDPEVAPMIEGFLASRREVLAQMAEALDKGERETLRRLAHRAAGSFGLYGFEWAARHSRQIELHAQDGETAQLAEAVTRLREHMDTVQIRQT